MKKRLLSLALALVLALALLPTEVLAAEMIAASPDSSSCSPSLLEEGVPSRDYDYADARIPVRINEPYIELDSYAVPDAVSDDILRISYVVKQETMTYDDEALEVYTIYPGSIYYRQGCPGDEYSVNRVYAATAENGVLRKGELLQEYEPKGPNYSFWRWFGSDDVGNYYIIEFESTLFSKTLGLHIVEGSQPASAPKSYSAEGMGMSQKSVARYAWNEFRDIPAMITSVPAGTVITCSRGQESYWCAPIDAITDFDSEKGIVCAPAASELPTYSCNGRQCFTVEPGMLYQVWDDYLLWDGEKYWVGPDLSTYFVADESVPAVSDAPASAVNTAYASTQTVQVDGKAVTFECYALKDANGNATNYIKLRDLAMLLNGSAAQFQVGWDGSVTITTKTAYTPNGSELSTPYSGDRAYQETTATTKVNGQAADLAAFVLNDDAGGGYTYYQLRDLGKALGFNVGWAADKGIFVETDKPYDTNN